MEGVGIECHGPDTVCQSKFSQLPTGGLGLKVSIDNDNGFCGPWGKCIGYVIMNVDITNPTNLSAAAAPGPASVASPAPAAPSSPAPAAPASAVPPMWLECGLPAKAKADIDNKEDWKICQEEVMGPTASCKVPLFKELEAGKKKKGYCLLTDGQGGKRLTQPYWSAIINVHDKVEGGAETEKKEKKAKQNKKDKRRRKEKKEKKDKKESTDKEVKKESKDVEVKKVETDDSMKLPWMADKEERQAARKAKKAKEEDKPKPAKKQKKPDYGENDSELPWMDGKKNTKPPVSEALNL